MDLLERRFCQSPLLKEGGVAEQYKNYSIAPNATTGVCVHGTNIKFRKHPSRGQM